MSYDDVAGEASCKAKGIRRLYSLGAISSEEEKTMLEAVRNESRAKAGLGPLAERGMMKVVKCQKCGACLAVGEGDAVQLNTVHIEGTAYIYDLNYGMQISIRCRHCKRMTLAVFPSVAQEAIPRG